MLEGKSDYIALRCVAETCQGGRPENQDDLGFLDTPLGFLCIICDGMGGGPGGKTASYIVKYEITKTLCACDKKSDIEHAFKMAVARAQSALEDKVKEVPSLNGMGSTFVAILINKTSALVAHAGDSRCYQLRGNKCIYKSVDHSLVSELVQRKVLTEEEARKSPQSNIITRGLGCVSNNVPEFDVLPFHHGDRFVICTDGVWGAMPHADIVSRVTQKLELNQLITNLSHEVDQVGFAKGGGHDNHTIAIIDVKEDSLLKESIIDKIKRNKKEYLFIGGATLVILIICITLINLLSGQEKRVIENTTVTSNRINFMENTDNDKQIQIGGDSCVKEVYKVDSMLKVFADSLRKDSVFLDSANVVFVFTSDSIRARETIQRIVNRLGETKNVSETKQNQATNKISDKRKAIIGQIKYFTELTTDSIALEFIQRVSLFVNDDRNWYVGQNNKRFCLTTSCSQQVDVQVKELLDFKKRIK